MESEDLAAAISSSVPHEEAPKFISLLELQYQDFEVGQQTIMLILESLGKSLEEDEQKKEFENTVDKLRELLQDVE